MKAWFGEQEVGEDGRWKLAGTMPRQLADFNLNSGSAGLDKDANLEQIAIDVGLCSSHDYMRLMHNTAILLAKNRIRMMLSSKDADIVQSIKALDTMNDTFNEISGRLTEWYGIHHPQHRYKPQEIISAILDRPRPSATDDTLTGAPLGIDDLAALQGYALVARQLLEGRKSLENYITISMEEAAPNVSDVLGPMLGARLIARAGGLDRLSRMTSGSIQVMGAGEALYKHLREGTPSPKHGFIYRHPLIVGAPKHLRG
ncbi:MAG TPA: RNA-processing protein, partial [Methanocella sp.]|nr:RNA-processing protein [Methanocella sp.]